MDQKLILVLEDDPKMRESLTTALETAGLRVVHAGTTEEAERLVEEHGARLDVLLLDMQLVGSRMTGAEFGLKVKERLAEQTPEFLIYSARRSPAYYELALRLQVATYLHKAAADTFDVVRQVRVLALRRSLQPAFPGLTEAIDTLARESRSSSEAMVRFLDEILCPQLTMTLGARFVLLVSTASATVCLGSSLGLPETSAAFDWLQAQAHASTVSDPLIVDPAIVPELGAGAGEVFERLQQAVFIPLGRTPVAGDEDVRISLGVLQESQGSFGENAVKLVEVLGVFIQPALGYLLKLVEKFASLHARQRAVLEATGEFCLFVGQEQVAAFSRVLESGYLQLDRIPRDLERLLVLGENLRKAGELLTWIGRPRPRTRGFLTGEKQALWLPGLIRDAWRDLLFEFPDQDPGLLKLEGEECKDCRALGNHDDYQIAVTRLLRWLVHRLREIPSGVEPELKVVCSWHAAAGEARVSFADSSRRLPKVVRKRLFSPFATPLLEDPEGQRGTGEILSPYIVKMLIEVEGQGRLEDRSDQLDGNVGHFFLMRFPQVGAAQTSSLVGG